jgi:hypothetical protein
MDIGAMVGEFEELEVKNLNFCMQERLSFSGETEKGEVQQ